MPIIAQERDVLLSFGSILAALGVALLVRAIMWVIATLLSTYTRPRAHTHSYTHKFLLLLAFTLLLLALPTGLAPHITVIAAALAALAAPYRRTATFVLCVAVLTLAAPRWISTVQLEIPPAQTTWVSRYYGQVAIWPAESITSTQYFLIVYNDVKLTRLPCEDHKVSRRTLCEAENDRTIADPMGWNQTRVLVSLGDQTSIYALESCRDSLRGKSPFMHQITLLGTKSTLHNLTIRCRLQKPELDTIPLGPTACLNLVSDVVLLNVHVELYNTSGVFLSSHKIHKANGCTEALEQLQDFIQLNGINVKSFLTCIPRLNSHDLLQRINDERFLPSVLKKEIPSSLRWIWRAPGILQNILEQVNNILEHIILPASTLAMAKLSDLLVTLKIFIVYAVERLRPYIYSILKNTQMLVYGVSCTTMKGIFVSFCQTHDAYDKSNFWYQLGVRIVEISSNTVRLLLDAVDLVPGFWTAYSFAWRLEWSLTVYCIQTIKIVIVEVCIKVIEPLFRLLSINLGRLFYTVLRLAPLCFEAIGFTTIINVIGKLFKFVWYLEMQWLAKEWVIVQKLFWYICLLLVAVLSFLLSVWSVCWGWGVYILGLYTTTSMAAHFFVALIQTIIILIAMRNELREIAARESGKYPSFMRQYTGGMFVIMMMTFTRVHSVTTVRYLVAHVAVLFMLVGLSVLRIFSKVYNITLYIVFPCISSYVGLEFVSKQPKRSSVIAISIAKGVLVVLVDRTIGNFVSLFLRELFFFLLLLLLSLVVIGSWQKQLHTKLTSVCQQLLLVLMPRADSVSPQAIDN
ncbi:uncharacterized protein TM35_000045010 [Trypanosoma theileri]|uniref:Uncharacterized protein n=1 Tax=Trypanosoma theileri TaxID=67003 RepID=A0A1X0P5S8_9TRYP|nr:uncharacterized protein TM35_000045010 [Trypanosoma theileri]ORC92287.1 hypothetical protein TM35_000045010 [Trypanosoma theileri]